MQNVQKFKLRNYKFGRCQMIAFSLSQTWYSRFYTLDLILNFEIFGSVIFAPHRRANNITARFSASLIFGANNIASPFSLEGNFGAIDITGGFSNCWTGLGGHWRHWRSCRQWRILGKGYREVPSQLIWRGYEEAIGREKVSLIPGPVREAKKKRIPF